MYRDNVDIKFGKLLFQYCNKYNNSVYSM